MAYTAVPTVATGDTWTAANHNTYIRDNFAAGVPDAFTAKGDLFVGTGADAGTRVGVGANGTELVADSSETTGVKWTTPAHNATSAAVHGLPSGANVLGNKSAAGEFVQRGRLASTTTGGSGVTTSIVLDAVTFPVAFSSAPIVLCGGSTDAVSALSCARSITTTGFTLVTGAVNAVSQAVSNSGWLAIGS
jgi:hypothetical protein